MVMVAGIVLAQCSSADGLAAAHAMVSLVEQGWATQTEVSRAFQCSIRTVRRHQRRFEEGGLASLARSDGFPRDRSRVPEARRRLVQRLREEGHSQREIARRIGVSEKAVRKLLRRLGWRPVALAQPELVLNGPATADPTCPLFFLHPPPRPRSLRTAIPPIEVAIAYWPASVCSTTRLRFLARGAMGSSHYS